MNHRVIQVTKLKKIFAFSCIFCEHSANIFSLGDQTHIFLRCPATANLISDTATQIDQILRLFDAPPWSSLTDAQRVSILLGTSPISLLEPEDDAHDSDP